MIVRKCLRAVKSQVKENQSYIRPGVIQQMCQGEMLNERESRMFRVLFRRFMRVEFRMGVSSMDKLRKKEKLAYFRVGKRFLRCFIGSKQ